MASGLHFPVSVSEELKRAGRGRVHPEREADEPGMTNEPWTEENIGEGTDIPFPECFEASLAWTHSTR